METTKVTAQEIAEISRSSRRQEAAGDLAGAAESLTRLALLCGADARQENPLVSRLEHADVCRRLGEALSALDQFAEAARALQEATDLYGEIPTPEAQEAASVCAKAVLAAVGALWAKPSERLRLLLANHEFRLAQFCLESGTEQARAEVCMRIAAILARRERAPEAVIRYRSALEWLAACAESPEVALLQGLCLHRIGGIEAYVLNKPAQAFADYSRAVERYEFALPDQAAEEGLAFCRMALREFGIVIPRE